jgi:CRP-like cAMP-binding protein
MSTHERLRLLRATRELGRFSDAQLQSLLPYLDEQCVAAGVELASEGRLCHQFVIVASGSLETCRQGRAGALGPGDTFGWRAMHERGLNEASVRAAAPAHLLVMSHEQFRAAAGLSL